MEFKHFDENSGIYSSYQTPMVERLREKTFVERNNDLCCKLELELVLELGGLNFQPKLFGYLFSYVSLIFLLIVFKDFSIHERLYPRENFCKETHIICMFSQNCGELSKLAT